MMKDLKIAAIGAGYINDFHVRGLKEQPGVEVVAVCSAHLEKAQDFAERHSIKDIASDINDLLKRDDIDAVVMGVPNKYHAPYTIDFLKNGKDVFQEKPLAMNSSEGSDIMKVSQDTGQMVMVGHMWRFDGETCYIKNVVQSGRIGKVIKTLGYGVHVNWGPAGWFVDKDLAGGGALADMGVHAIDTVRYILGDPLPEKVYARIGTYYGDYDVDDTGITMITWDNGVTSVIESGWWHPHVDGPEAATRLYGTEGYASLYPTKLKLKEGDIPGEFFPGFVPKKHHCDQLMYSRQMAYFVDCLRNRTAPVPGLNEGQVVMNIVDAAYQSSETGEAIAL